MSLVETNWLEKNLDNVNISDVLQKTTDKLQNVESSIANNIKDTGTITANAITNAAPTLSNTRKRRFFGGKKKLKSSLKQDRKKKRKKSVRFDI